MLNLQWRPSPTTRKYGVAISSYSGGVQHALPLEIGETVHIQEEYLDEDGTATWYLGCSFGNKNKKGIFPSSHIHTKKSVVENEGPYETVMPIEDAVVKELTFVLREWLVIWKDLFVSRKKQLYHSIQLVMAELVKFRSTLVSDTLTKEQAMELKQQVVTIIDWGNGKLGMDLVPRVEYQQANPDTVSVVEMHRIHQRSVENCEGAWPGGKVSVKKKHKVQPEIIHHLLVEVRNFACTVSDNAEVLISLYDDKDSCFISEKFVVYVDKSGYWRTSGQSSNIAPSTLFTDLSHEDKQREIYLVVQIIRKGVLLLEGNLKKMPTTSFRRPWGVTVVPLKDLFQIQPENEMEYFLRVQCVDNESQFSTLHETLIKRQMNMSGRGGNTDKQNQGITLSIKLVSGELKNAKIEHPILINKGMVLTPRLGFSDFINPGEVRNDLYLTISGAELDRGSKKAHKNVLVEVTVFNSDCQVIDSCISCANGTPMTSHFYSCVFYHTNSPRWNETIRLSIPIERFNTSHIRLELSHCSSQDKQAKKLFGFAYLALITRDNVTRQDGSYELCIYKVEDSNKIKNYLHLPSLQDDFNDPKVMPSIPDNIPFSRSNKESVTVKTFLCSSKFAQKTKLLKILQWNSLNLSEIQTSLDNLVTIKGQDLVRYLQDVLDALFNMFNAGDRGARVVYAMSIFHALIHIFNLLQEKMFDKFACVLEDFLEKSFSSPVAHRDMMYCLRHMVEQIYTCTDFDEQTESKRVFKVLEDIFKFSVKSCMLSRRMHGDQLMNEFHNSLHEVFKTFGKVLQSSEQILHKAQNQLLENIHKCFLPLLQIMSPEALADLVVYLIDKVSKDAPKTVLRGKTQLMKNTISSPLFTDPISRNKLLPKIVAHLKRCFIQQRHLILSSNTFADLLSCVFTLKQTFDVQDEITKIVQGMFDVTVRLLNNLTNEQSKDIGSLLTSCLTEMLRLMDVHHYQKLMSDYPKPNHLKDFLNRVLLAFKQLVNKDIFPTDWTSMRMITNNIMLTSIQYIAADLTDNFLHGGEFDRELWTNFFLLAVSFITQPALQLEQYSEAKSGQITDRYSDMRVPVGCQIYSLWNQLEDNTQVLVMDLLGPFLQVSMVPQIDLRKATIPIFYDIMRCELRIYGDLKQMEDKMLHELYLLVLEHHGDASYKELLGSMLLDKVQSEPENQEEGKRFVSSVTDLLERLLHDRAIEEEQRDTKMHCTFNILNFYKDSREDMYIRYITRLHELHFSANNFVEAGLTLRLYANLLSWTDKVLPVEMTYACQTEMSRKEDLLTRVLDCFTKGNSWEYGIQLCKELAEHYEDTFQYKKLGEILIKQAEFLKKILEEPRQDPTYYRVAYYGNTFPPYLKNKAFIYRGDECLKLPTIMSQLKNEYPSASILTDNSPPDESYKHGDAQSGDWAGASNLDHILMLAWVYGAIVMSLLLLFTSLSYFFDIQIGSVKPVCSQHPMFEGKTVPSEISFFYQCNEVDTFQFDRPYHRADKDKQNEFKSLCLERTILKTSYKLPGILRWYEVVSTQLIQLCPVQTATNTVLQMNAELRSSTQKASSRPEQHLGHLEMRLQGVISGAVNGGIPKYQEAFFNEEYTNKYPAEKEYIEDLKASIHDQIQLLERGLVIHKKYASAEMQPLHQIMVEGFDKIKTSMGYSTKSQAKRGSSVVSLALSSNRPSTPSSMSLNSSGSNRSSVVSGSEIVIAEGENPYDEADNVPLPACHRAGSQPNLNNSMNSINSINNNEEKDDVPPILPARKKSVSESIGSLGALSPTASLRSPSLSASTPPPIPRRDTVARMPTSSDGPSFRSKTRSEGGEDQSASMPPRPPRTQMSSPGITSAATPPSNSPSNPSSIFNIPPLPAKRTNSSSSSSTNSFNLNTTISPPPPSPHSNTSMEYSQPPPSFESVINDDNAYCAPPPQASPPPFPPNSHQQRNLPKPPIPRKQSVTPERGSVAATVSAVNFDQTPSASANQSVSIRPPPRASIARATAVPLNMQSNSNGDEPPPLPKRKQSHRL